MNRARYEAIVIEALDDAGAKVAMATGRPERLVVRIKSPDASDVVVLDMDFGPYPTPEERASSCMAAATQAVDKLVEIEERERKKVARCPTCSEWFETFQARNEHREKTHRAVDVATGPEIPIPPAASSGGLVEW